LDDLPLQDKTLASKHHKTPISIEGLDAVKVKIKRFGLADVEKCREVDQQIVGRVSFHGLVLLAHSSQILDSLDDVRVDLKLKKDKVKNLQ